MRKTQHLAGFVVVMQVGSLAQFKFIPRERLTATLAVWFFHHRANDGVRRVRINRRVIAQFCIDLRSAKNGPNTANPIARVPFHKFISLPSVGGKNTNATTGKCVCPYRVFENCAERDRSASVRTILDRPDNGHFLLQQSKDRCSLLRVKHRSHSTFRFRAVAYDPAF
jgi:hypothetical protein